MIFQLSNGEANINDPWWFIETSAYLGFFLQCKSFDFERERIMLQVFILMLIICFWYGLAVHFMASLWQDTLMNLSSVFGGLCQQGMGASSLLWLRGM